MTEVDVYVPVAGSNIAKLVLPRSAIVSTTRPDADPGETDYLVVDYEGNRYGAGYFTSFRNRLAHAADRHLSRYPTIARCAVERSELVRVGTWHPEEERLDVEDSDALLDWLGGEVEIEDLGIENLQSLTRAQHEALHRGEDIPDA